MNESSRLKLVIPTIEYKEQVMEYRRAFMENNESIDGGAGLEETETFEEWINFEQRLYKKYGKQYVTSTVYLAIRREDNKMVGIIDFRHTLSDFLYKYGGNIGYSVLPSERGKGYAKEMLGLMLEECKKTGIGRVLITCDKENIASEKTILANGGVLENEVVDDVSLGKSGVIKRYWISLKKRFADEVKSRENVIDVEEKMKTINDSKFKGDIYLKNFKKIDKPYLVPSGVCIQDNDYKWLDFYKYESRIRMCAIYNDKNEIIEWYFDIARGIGKENGIPYEDDMYLDVVLRPNGEIILLDEDELKEAFDRKEMTKEEYDEAYKIAYELIEKLKGKENKMKQFTDKYLNEML